MIAAVVVAVLGLLWLSLALGVSPARAAGLPFGSQGSFVSGLEGPVGVGVEVSSGDVFVTAGASSDELQKVTVSGPPTGGTFELEFEGEKTTPLAYEANEVETVTVGGASGGTFGLTFKAFTTESLPYNASAAEVQSELVKLTSVGAGNMLVTGSPGAYRIELTGALKHASYETITCGSSLTPGGAKCEVAITTKGGRTAGTGVVADRVGKPLHDRSG